MRYGRNGPFILRRLGYFIRDTISVGLYSRHNICRAAIFFADLSFSYRLNYVHSVYSIPIHDILTLSSVEIFKCFRPGDVVRCRVTSMGEQKSFILSTAHNSLGVVMAQSLAGYTMVPVSWEKMVCIVKHSL